MLRSVRDERGAGVLLIDHNMALVMEVCDRIHVLDQGKTLAEGTPEAVRANLDVAAAYLGESAVRAGVRSDGAPEPVSTSRVWRCGYGSIARRKFDLSVEQGEIVGESAQTAQEVDDAAPDHGRRTTERRRGLCSAVSPSAVAPRREIVRAGIALVPEGRRIYAELTVEEEPPSRALGTSDEIGAAEAVAGVFELFPIIEETRRRHAGLLSGGQQQQLAIGRALVAEPDVLLLDEPSLGLAPTVVDTVFEALRTIRERGVTILLVEQRAQRTVALADRTYVLSNGELRMTLGPEDAGDTRRMVDAYFGSS